MTDYQIIMPHRRRDTAYTIAELWYAHLEGWVTHQYFEKAKRRWIKKVACKGAKA